jgi:hypothetical protein
MLKGQNLLRKLGLLGGISCLLLLDLQGVVHAQLSTAEHLSKPGYWPTKDERSSEEFVGATVCAKCHTRIAQVQETTRMPRTLTRAGDAEPLRLHPFLSFHSGHYNYEIKTSESGEYLYGHGR